MSVNALEFNAALSPGLITAFNRNPRKWRILQANFQDGAGFLPLAVGTFPIDPTTGQPTTQSGSGVAMNTPFGTNTLVATGASQNLGNTVNPLGQAFTYFKVIIFEDTAGLYSFADATQNDLFLAYLPANSYYELDFPNGFVNPQERTSKGNQWSVKGPLGATMNVYVYYGGPS